jgi:hypothetical protein
MKVETTVLMTIKNYAAKYGITTSYVYKLIKNKEVEPVFIDGIKFIDTSKYKTSPTKR